MEYIALYRKYRPKTFDEVIGQDHVVEALRNSVRTNRTTHAYLLCGTRGTGKTSIAKIFARAVNCLDQQDGNPCNKCRICVEILSERLLDVIEIDAASNNSVDNVRDIRDEVIYLPSEAKHKVYIIDEVHMLSTGAFNALLKTLEEPPEHVMFILATTEPQKLPATILSRCQRYDFKRISLEDIYSNLNKLCKDLGITAEEKALRLIAKVADGALRDAQSILDKCISVIENDLTFSDVFKLAGISDMNIIRKIIEDVMDGKIDDIIEQVDNVELNGTDLKYFLSEVIEYLRNLLVCVLANDFAKLIVADDDVIADMKMFASKIGKEKILDIIEELSMLNREVKWTQKPRIFIEVAFIELALKNRKKESNTEIVIEKKEEYQDNLIWDKTLKKLHTDGKILITTYLTGTVLNVLGNRYSIVFKNEDSIKMKTVEKNENLEQVKQALSKIVGKNDLIIKCEIKGKVRENEETGFSENEVRSFFKDIPIEIVDN